MPLATISVGDVETIAKLNLAINKVNSLDAGLATETLIRADGDSFVLTNLIQEIQNREGAITEEINQRGFSDAELGVRIDAEATARDAAVSDEADARAAEDALRPTYAAAAGSGLYWARALAGAPASLTAVPLSDFINTATGAAVPLTGAAIISGLEAKRIEPGRKYRARFVAKRTTNSVDPINDAVRLGVAWLSSSHAFVSQAVLIDLPLLVVDGRVEYSCNIATTAADDIDFTIPDTAIYARPFVQTYGTGVTNVEVLEIKDLTDSVDYSPDVSSYRNEIAALLARIETLEDLVGA